MKTESTGFFLSSLVRFFHENSTQVSRRRSRAGLLIALILLPLLLGVLACLPVPVGDPEKSQIDPALSGIWLVSSDDEYQLMVLDPFDKRTWLVSWVDLEEKAPLVSGQKDDSNQDEEESEASALELLRNNQFEADSLALFKGWLTKIEGKHFLTLEPKIYKPGATPKYWWVFQVQSDDADRLELVAVNIKFGGLEDVKSSGEAEKIIGDNLENPELYGDSMDYHKVSPNDNDTVTELLEKFGADDGT